MLTGIARVTRSLQNYVGRMIAAPLTLVLLLMLARFVDTRRPHARGTHSILVTVLLFPCVWMLVFLAPVLPIVARSEIYLYLPVFGVCLMAGLVGSWFGEDMARHRATVVALGLFVVTLGAYQVSRGAAMSRDLDFSLKLVDALHADPAIAASTGPIALVPADAETERYLQDAIGGYLYSVLRRAFPDGHVTGVTQYAGTRVTGTVIRVMCRYQQGAVTLIHEGE